MDVCGPTGENGERGQIIQVAENLISSNLSNFIPFLQVNKNWGKNRGRGGQQPQQQRPMSRHMVSAHNFKFEAYK